MDRENWLKRLVPELAQYSTHRATIDGELFGRATLGHELDRMVKRTTGAEQLFEHSAGSLTIGKHG
jgi:hypothetical protein